MRWLLSHIYFYSGTLIYFPLILSETSGKLGAGGMLVSLWAEIRLVQIN